MGRPLDGESGDLGSGPGSATSCYVALVVPLPLWAYLLGSPVGNQVTSADAHLLEPLLSF